MTSAITRLNDVQRGIAKFMNPHGYYRCMMPGPPSLEELRDVYELHDRHRASVPVRHENPFNIQNSKFDSVAFYAAHDRYHLKHNLSFAWEDEMQVGAYQYADIRSFDPRAAKFQLLITLTGAHWDKEVGEGYAPKWPDAIDVVVKRMRGEEAWDAFGGQAGIFDSYDYLLPFLDGYMEFAR